MSIYSKSPLVFNYDKNTYKTLNHFWFGIVIYMGAYALSTTTIINFIFCQAIQILGLVITVSAAIKLIKWEFDASYLKVTYILYYIWLFLVIIRGFKFDYENLKFMLFDADFGLFPYLVPLILLFPKNIKYYKNIFTVIVVLGILFIIYDMIFYTNLMDLNYENNNTKFTFEHFAKILSIPSGFIILTYVYNSNKKKLFALLVIFTSVTFSIIRARRALLFMSLSPLIVACFFYFFNNKRKISILFFSLLFGAILLNLGINFYENNVNGAFYLITNRIDQDTRSGVEECFYKDMNTKDWIIGKGINGKYFCPGIDMNDRTGYRSMIETDYLNIILKGGIISLALLILILVPAIFKGLFYSKNLLSKASSFWILLWLINLYPATVYTFSLNHLLVWLSVGICYSKSIRETPESTLIKILFN